MKIKQTLPRELVEDLDNRLEAFDTQFKRAGFALTDESMRSELIRVFAFSNFVAQSSTGNPQMINDLIMSGDLHRKYSAGEYTQTLKQILENMADDDALGKALRQYRNREMVRIAWRDLSGAADLFQTMTDLSAFADACVDETFSLLYNRHCKEFGTPADPDGSPLDIVVLGMGKLGAGELNFSSDIDLVFAYPEAGETIRCPKSISNEEFFTGLARGFLKVFSDTTSGGLLFRVDLRLRPFGENGPLVMSFSAMEEYYQRQGREWERYALIKARVVAGDKEAGALLLERLRPFIYRRYLDYGVYESIREMKKKISFEIERKGLTENIKLGQGGIREVEFFGQIFQLIRGGVEPILREGRILSVLATLVQEGYIPQKVCDELISAYIFLRNTEHRLQEYSDQQTHNLPAHHSERIRLAASMGFESWESYEEQLHTHMKNVHFHFDKLLVSPDEESRESSIDALDAVWKGLPEKEESEKTLAAAGYHSPGEISMLLEVFRDDIETRSLSSYGRDRLNKLMPLVLEKVGLSQQPDQALKRIVDLIKTIERRTCYISLLLENHEALDQLVELGSASLWIISFLSRYPVLLDELLDARSLYTPPTKVELKRSLLVRLERVPRSDLELQMEELTIFKQANILRVAAADVAGAFKLMRVSDYLSDIAETVLDKVLELSWEHLVEKHGRPICSLGGEVCDTGFAVVAFGKLGGLELGYGSDLDLIFLHAGTDGRTDRDSGPIDTRQFYARLGQRILHLLTTHTGAGKLYEIDMRLRPSGSSGPLVINVEAYYNYMKEEAWTWEHQALVRARAICGDNEVIQRFEEIRRDILCLPRNQGKLMEDIRSMRDRMRKEHQTPDKGGFNIKQGVGGIVDIEFLVQYLVLLNANKHVEPARWSDNVRQLEALAKASVLEESKARLLREAYLTLRRKVHNLSLQEKPALVPENEFHTLRNEVVKIWKDYLCAED